MANEVVYNASQKTIAKVYLNDFYRSQYVADIFQGITGARTRKAVTHTMTHLDIHVYCTFLFLFMQTAGVLIPFSSVLPFMRLKMGYVFGVRAPTRRLFIEYRDEGVLLSFSLSLLVHRMWIENQINDEICWILNGLGEARNILYDMCMEFSGVTLTVMAECRRLVRVL